MILTKPEFTVNNKDQVVFCDILELATPLEPNSIITVKWVLKYGKWVATLESKDIITAVSLAETTDSKVPSDIWRIHAVQVAVRVIKRYGILNTRKSESVAIISYDYITDGDESLLDTDFAIDVLNVGERNHLFSIKDVYDEDVRKKLYDSGISGNFMHIIDICADRGYEFIMFDTDDGVDGTFTTVR